MRRLRKRSIPLSGLLTPPVRSRLMRVRSSESGHKSDAFGGKTEPVTDPIDQRAPPMLALWMSRRSDLVRFFTARTRSAADAEDIVQEIYLKLSAMGDVVIENPAAYLYRLGTNVMLDRMRARRRADARDDAYHQTFTAGPSGEDTHDAPSPERAIDARRRLDKVMAAVAAMPPQCRRVFLMHKIEGLSYAEVAGALGVSKSAVEKHMITALKRLAEHRE